MRQEDLVMQHIRDRVVIVMPWASFAIDVITLRTVKLADT